MAGADGNDAASAAQRMRERAARALNHTPALKLFAAWATKVTDDGFQISKELDGAPFPALAPSTIAQRLSEAGALKKSKRRTSGLTKKSEQRYRAMTAPGGMKPLVKTARMRNSQRMQATGKNGLEWSAIGYLAPHITGSASPEGRPPRRNPTVFSGAGDTLTLKPKAREKLNAMVSSYIETGKVEG